MGRALKKMVANKRDEMYTPRLLVDPIIKYIPKDAIVWCPFDTEKSEFVIGLKEAGIQVTHSHIANGFDFFKYEPKYWDLVVSNPPFTSKLEVFDRLYSFEKPFAVLMNLMVLNYQEVGNFFYNKDSDLQLLIPDKKVSFDGNTSSFNTSYFCRNLLQSKIEFFHLSHNNSGKFYSGSKMWEDEERILAVV